jgi:GT2 family glycosyltransferase
VSTPRASIVLLCHNALDFTAACVESIARHTPESHEVVLVDNGSSDGTADWFAARGEGCLIRNATNLGFAAGVNQGMAAAEGETVVLLNNDALATPGWLGALLDALDRDPEVGIAVPRSNHVAGVQLLRGVGYAEAPSEALDAFAAERAAALAGQGFVADRVMGLCMAIRRDVVDIVGGFDPVFRIGNFEDDDYSIRTRLAGYTLWVCDDSYVHHYGHTTFKLLPEDYRALLEENALRFGDKWEIPAGSAEIPAAAGGFDPARDYVPLPLLG